jgi:hypothetical protein
MHRKPVMTPSSIMGPTPKSTPTGMRWRAILVTSILGAVAMIVVVGVRAHREIGRRSLIKSHVDKVAEQVWAFAKVHGRYPRDLNELVEQRYINGEQTVDAWGSELEYRTGAGGIDGGFIVCSFGPDGRGDNEDDSCSNSDHR